jgi:hypothetical protein
VLLREAYLNISNEIIDVENNNKTISMCRLLPTLESSEVIEALSSDMLLETPDSFTIDTITITS